MAFKMKGSPIKLGKIQGTAGHASALKQTKEQKEQLEEKLAELEEGKRKSKFDKLAEEEGTRKSKKSKFDKLTEEEGKAKSAVEMKSPVKNYSMDWGGENKHNTAHTKHNAGKGPDPHGDEKNSPTKMKSPMKGEKKMVDGVELHPDGHEGHHRVGKDANQKWGKETGKVDKTLKK